MNTHAQGTPEACAPEAQRFPETEKLIARWKELKANGLEDFKTFPFLYPESTPETFCRSVNAILGAESVAHPESLFIGEGKFTNRT